MARRRSSGAEFRRYVVMALGSLEECKLWCHYAADLGLAEPGQARKWHEDYEEIARMLQGLRRHLLSF